MQVDGLIYTFNSDFPVGQRLISAQVKDANGTLSDINPNAVYSICTNSFMSQGGDGYTMIPPNAFNVLPFGPVISQTVVEYVRYIGMVNITLDGRIKRTNQTVSMAVIFPGIALGFVLKVNCLDAASDHPITQCRSAQ